MNKEENNKKTILKRIGEIDVNLLIGRIFQKIKEIDTQKKFVVVVRLGDVMTILLVII